MINLYYHGGSENHGCEAIVRSTSKLLSTKLFLWSTAPNTDCTYGLDNVVSIQEDGSVPLAGLKSLTFKMHHKLTGSDIFYTKFSHRNFFSAVQCGDVYLLAETTTAMPVKTFWGTTIKSSMRRVEKRFSGVALLSRPKWMLPPQRILHSTIS